MQTFTYVDNSNVFIEGQRVSAVQKGMARTITDAIDRRIIDFDWRLDYGNLHSLLCGERSEIGAANLWGSPPPGDSFWKMVERTMKSSTVPPRPLIQTINSAPRKESTRAGSGNQPS